MSTATTPKAVTSASTPAPANKAFRRARARVMSAVIATFCSFEDIAERLPELFVSSALAL